MSKLKLAESALSSLSLKDKKVIVVGGTSGIGEGIAKCCASLGANITIVGRNEVAGNNTIIIITLNVMLSQFHFTRNESLSWKT